MEDSFFIDFIEFLLQSAIVILLICNTCTLSHHTKVFHKLKHSIERVK